MNLPMTQAQVPMLMPAPAQWTQMMQMGDTLLKSGFLPTSIKTPAQAVAIMLKGWEMGVPAMQAFAQISVIQGKPAVGAELMLARIYERFPNADIQVVKRDADGCHIKARRDKKREYVDFKFETEDARKAELLGKDNWRKYPKNMYYWRAVSDMARAMWPECLAGASHTPEELGAVVDEQGEIVDIPAQAPSLQAVSEEPKPAPAKVQGPPFDPEDTFHKEAVDKQLAKKGVPKEFWPDIKVDLKGRPTTDLDAVIEDVRKRPREIDTRI